MKAQYIPPIRRDYPDIFPSQFETVVQRSDLDSIKTFTDDGKANVYNDLSLQDYLKDFHNRPAFYDLHETNFQNFAIRITQHMSVEERKKLDWSKDHANKRLLRARIYAASTRNDLDWNSVAIESQDRNRKTHEMEQYWLSLKLYDWYLAPPQEEESIQTLISSAHDAGKIIVSPLDTESAVIEASKAFPAKKIAWLNLANAHNTCGTYNVAFGGSQEEHVAPHSTAVSTLGLVADRIDNSTRVWVSKGEHHMMYKIGKHIPPGGAYFCKTKFLTCEPHVECYMIAAAFADFRTYYPFFTSYSERNYYYKYFGYGGIKDEQELEQRLMLDIEGVLKTAIKEGIEVLILGAGGCGAFRHSPWREAKLWKASLNKYKTCFHQIQFAILPDENSPDNVKAFEKIVMGAD